MRPTAELDRTLFRITPKIENTTEKPRTKKIVFSKMFSRLVIRLTVPLFLCSSDMVVPEIYAKKAGIMGNMHGATKEPSPAKAATAIVSSDIRTIRKLFY